jgi:hypothetical protein
MKSAIAIAAALALCGSAFAAGVVDTVKQDAHQIGSSFMHDAHRVASGETYRESEGVVQHRTHAHTTAMGAGPETDVMSSGRRARMDAAYANWQRSHR